jgi:hypothetical protein
MCFTFSIIMSYFPVWQSISFFPAQSNSLLAGILLIFRKNVPIIKKKLGLVGLQRQQHLNISSYYRYYYGEQRKPRFGVVF